jgi:hypothetical protein
VGIDVVLQTGDGRQIDSVGDPKNVLHELLPSADDATFSCLPFVDRYGDTTFNAEQMIEVVKEIDRILERLEKDPEGAALLRRVRELASRNQSRFYPKFIGD